MRIRKQAGHGRRHDRVGSGQCTRPAIAQEPQVSDFQDVGHQRHRTRRGHGMAR